MPRTSDDQLVHISVGAVGLEGVLALPPRAEGVVVFVHGSGSSRHSPRNTFVAQELQTAGLGTFLFDLLTKAEDIASESRFDIDLSVPGSELVVDRQADEDLDHARLPPPVRLLQLKLM